MRAARERARPSRSGASARQIAPGLARWPARPAGARAAAPTPPVTRPCAEARRDGRAAAGARRAAVQHRRRRPQPRACRTRSRSVALTVLPMDLLRPDLQPPRRALPERLLDATARRSWRSLEQVAPTTRLDAVYLTNFGCGPDSFLLSYAEEIMGNRALPRPGARRARRRRRLPDAHRGLPRRAAAGRAAPAAPRRPAPPGAGRPAERGPSGSRPCTSFGADLFAAAFRRHGYDARPLPLETAATFELGRSLTRGSECLPTALTIGTFIATLRGARARGRPGALHADRMRPLPLRPVLPAAPADPRPRGAWRTWRSSRPSSVNAYQGVDDAAPAHRSSRPSCSRDILLKARCKVRPYERVPGSVGPRCWSEERARVGSGHPPGRRPAPRPAPRRRPDRRRSRAARAASPSSGSWARSTCATTPSPTRSCIDAIERLGGEAWPTPMAEWIIFLASPAQLHPVPGAEGRARRALKAWADLPLAARLGPTPSTGRPGPSWRIGGSRRSTASSTRRRPTWRATSAARRCRSSAAPSHFAREGAALVVNCAPFGCMPGTITTALFRHLSAERDMPIVSLFYDGQGHQNRRLEVFLGQRRAAVRRGTGRRAGGAPTSGSPAPAGSARSAPPPSRPPT